MSNFTQQQVNAAFDRAVEEVIEKIDVATGFCDQETRDLLVDVSCAATPPSGTRTMDEIRDCVNEAADVASEDLDEEGLRDAVNLMVNAGITYLTQPDSDLEAVALDCYDKPLAEIMGWVTA